MKRVAATGAESMHGSLCLAAYFYRSQAGALTVSLGHLMLAPLLFDASSYFHG